MYVWRQELQVLTGDSIKWTFQPGPFSIACHEYVEAVEQVRLGLLLWTDRGVPWV
jgi:hypothetical protein